MKTLLLLLAVALVGCSSQCGNTVKQEAASPDGKHIATAFIRNCGATTAFSPQVYLRYVTEKKVGDTGNVFIGNHSDAIRIEWESPTHLVIHSDCEVVYLVSQFYGISIEHRR